MDAGTLAPLAIRPRKDASSPGCRELTRLLLGRRVGLEGPWGNKRGVGQTLVGRGSRELRDGGLQRPQGMEKGVGPCSAPAWGSEPPACSQAGLGEAWVRMGVGGSAHWSSWFQGHQCRRFWREAELSEACPRWALGGP